MFGGGLTVTASTVKHLSFLHIPLIVIYGQTETHGGSIRQTFSCEFPLMKTDFTILVIKQLNAQILVL